LQAATSGAPVRRPWFGATGQEVTAELANALHLPRPGGVLVKDVTADGPAAKAGVRLGDVITAVGGHEVGDPDDLRYRIAILPMDIATPLQLWRNGQLVNATVTLVALPETPARQTTTLASDTPLSGATIANLNPAQADELGLATTLRGVAVVGTKSGTLADRLGLHPGDIIATVNRIQVASVKELKDAFVGTQGPWTFGIRRGGQLFAVSVR
jgi:serine protease Do